MPAPSRSARASADADTPTLAPFKKRSFTGTLAAAHSAVGSTDPVKVAGEIACERYTTPPPATGTPHSTGEFVYTGRLRIPRARSRGLIVGYEYRLAVAGDDVTAALDVVVKFVGTPDGASDPDVVAVDFAGMDARELAAV